MDAVTAAFAGAESPAIGRYERSATAGRASDRVNGLSVNTAWYR
jgi:hypothetical protein